MSSILDPVMTRSIGRHHRNFSFDFRTIDPSSAHAHNSMSLATDNAVKPFPQELITSAIEMWWEQKLKSQKEDPFALPSSLYDLVADIDSLATVDVLLLLEPSLGFELPLNVIQRGGYKDLPEMIEQLIPAVRKLYDKHNSKEPSLTRHAR